MRAPSIFGLGIIYYDHKIFWKTSISYRVGVKVGWVVRNVIFSEISA